MKVAVLIGRLVVKAAIGRYGIPLCRKGSTPFIFTFFKGVCLMTEFKIGNWTISLLADKKNHLNVSTEYRDGATKYYPTLTFLNRNETVLMLLLTVENECSEDVYNPQELLSYTDGFWKAEMDTASEKRVRISIFTENRQPLRISEMVGGSYFRADTRL